MSGHSKWSQIKRQKAVTDAKRGQKFTKLTKEITEAARAGGGDPAGNARLRLLLEKAREINMPADNAARAIKRGTGELPGVHYEQGLYEGYGPNGVAVLVEVLTENKNKAVADLRHAFIRNNGRLAEAGSVSWMFEKKGTVAAKANGHTEDELLEKLLDYEVDEIVLNNDTFHIQCSPRMLETVKKTVADLGMKPEDAEIEWVAKTPAELSESQAAAVYEFLELLEDLEDVQNVYSNLG
jgi:YebC/PmpR family DNA-binding regulatory protein